MRIALWLVAKIFSQIHPVPRNKFVQPKLIVDRDRRVGNYDVATGADPRLLGRRSIKSKSRDLARSGDERIGSATLVGASSSTRLPGLGFPSSLARHQRLSHASVSSVRRFTITVRRRRYDCRR